MVPDLLVVHFHEIALKGRNRGEFVAALRRNLVRALGDTASGVRSRGDRLEVWNPTEGALDRVRHTFGVANVMPARVVEARAEAVERAAVGLAEEIDAEAGFRSFAVRARRARTAFPQTSQELNVAVGDRIRTALDKKVDLTTPDVTFRIEIVERDAYVSAQRIPGPGGLPVGTAGRVVALLSGGIDSPVATWRMLKRGADVLAVHCHGQPFTDRSSEQNVGRLLEVLAEWGYRGPWWSVPIGEAQRAITVTVEARLRVLCYRRLMLRVAEKIAERETAAAVATGESLSQVASQTLDNMAAVEAIASLPVLRPLVGMDKVEIIDEARAVGTYDISVRPHQDCCTLFEPREAATRSTASILDEAEKPLDVDALVAASLEAGERRVVAPAGVHPVGTISS